MEFAMLCFALFAFVVSVSEALMSYGQGGCRKDSDCEGELAHCVVYQTYGKVGQCVCCPKCFPYRGQKSEWPKPICVKRVECKSDNDCDSGQFCCPVRRICFPESNRKEESLGDQTDPGNPCGAPIQPYAPFRKPDWGSQCNAKNPGPPTRCLKDNSKDLYPISTGEVVDRHNCWRAHVDPPANPSLKGLIWDDELAILAERWASQCQRNSDDPKARALPRRMTKGIKWDWVNQNICRSPWKNTTLSGCIDSWAMQKQDFKYGYGTINGKSVSSYTQVVSARTTHVGCGYAYCPQVDSPFIIVCNYAPGGNWKEYGNDGTTKPYPIRGY